VNSEKDPLLMKRDIEFGKRPMKRDPQTLDE
jgi:hypothetical protein